MRILYVPTEAPDGIGDMLYSGFKNLGTVTVYEYPFKPTLHDKDGSLTDKARPFWLVQSWSSENVLESFDSIDVDDYDHIIVNSPWFDTNNTFQPLVQKVGNRMVFIDGHDDPFFRSAISFCKQYFKREYVKGFTRLKWTLTKRNIKKYYFLSNYAKSHGAFNSPLILKRKRVLPINFSVVPHNFKKEDTKEIDVSLLTTPYTGFREKFFELFREISERRGLNCVIAPGNLKPSDYISTIQKSKIVLSLPGSSFDIFRYWEVPYYGTCLMSQRVPLKIDHNFEDGVSAVFFNGLRDFEDKLMGTLRNENYENIAKNGNMHFLRYHTDKTRAQKLLAEISEASS